MKTRVLGLVWVSLIAMVLAGCAAGDGSGRGYAGAEAPTTEATATDNAGADGETAPASRLLVRNATIVVVVGNPEEEAAAIRERVRSLGGWIEHDRVDSDSRVKLTVRVPEPQLDAFLDSIAGQGKVASRRVEAKDVTDEFRDTEARLENLKALRDRLREVLDRAATVEATLRVERELARVQGEIELLQGRLVRMESQIALSEVEITLRRKRIYGPVGAVLYGVVWTVEKLFVIR